jgi:hypothetical protein
MMLLDAQLQVSFCTVLHRTEQAPSPEVLLATSSLFHSQEPGSGVNAPIPDEIDESI